MPIKKLPKEVRSKIMLAFEFASVIASVAQERKISYTPELIAIAEDLLEKEMTENTAEKFAGDMVILALSVFTALESAQKEVKKAKK